MHTFNPNYQRQRFKGLNTVSSNYGLVLLAEVTAFAETDLWESGHKGPTETTDADSCLDTDFARQMDESGASSNVKRGPFKWLAL